MFGFGLRDRGVASVAHFTGSVCKLQDTAEYLRKAWDLYGEESLLDAAGRAEVLSCLGHLDAVLERLAVPINEWSRQWDKEQGFLFADEEY